MSDPKASAAPVAGAPAAAAASPAPAADHAPAILHTMLRIRDPQAMLGFYCGVLGMRELRRIEFPESRYTLIFIGYGPGKDSPQIEFWHDWNPKPATGHDATFGHMGIGVKDIHGFCAKLATLGIRIVREPGPMRPGGRVIALIEDPEGHEVELLAND
jgi:lactoylglutathione lyase